MGENRREEIFRILEHLRLEEILKITMFQPPVMGKVANH